CTSSNSKSSDSFIGIYPLSDQAEPFTDFCIIRLANFHPLPNPTVARQINGSQSRISLVPNFCRYLMPPLRVFECMLTQCTFLDYPPCRRITNSVTKSKIQSPANLVDEVIHIAFMATIVITGKENAMVVIHEYPAGKMDCFY